MKDFALTIENLSFAYPGGGPLLQEASLTVVRGDFLVILGPNGAAKTTLLRLMLGLLKPQKGRISYGESSTGVPLILGYVPQKASGFNPGFPATVEEVAGLELPGRPDQVKGVLQQVGLWEKRIALLGTLSGGQLQRLWIARALLQKPDILFLDEPFSGLDAKSQAEFLSLLTELHQQGLTILLVTHDLTPVARCATRYVRLNAGRILEIPQTSLREV